MRYASSASACRTAAVILLIIKEKFDVLRAAIVAAAAADAHMFNAVARFVVIDLMQGAVAQTLAGFFRENHDRRPCR